MGKRRRGKDEKVEHRKRREQKIKAEPKRLPRFEAGKVADVLNDQLEKSLPDVPSNRRASVAMDLALALVRSGWILHNHV